jgi:hypothetical protein
MGCSGIIFRGQMRIFIGRETLRRNSGVACALFPLLAGVETREGGRTPSHFSNWEAFGGEP